jgi:S1-C subfamily serine protease
MDSFGVISPRLKSLAKKVVIPSVLASQEANSDEIVDFMGAKVKDLTTLGERSATGMSDTRGVLVLEVAAGSGALKFLQANDVILSFNFKKINTLSDLLHARMAATGANTEVLVFRNQKELKVRVDLSGKK